MSWQDFQKRTFTAWVNEFLGRRGMHVENLEEDFKNGVYLINLLEIISNKKLPKYNHHPKVMSQKYENTQIAMNFINSEGIKLVNIGNTDITDGNLKLILGLIWTLILRYQVNLGKDGGDDKSAKNELLEWVRSKIPEYNIKGFTKDWNDGRALCALVNALSGNTLCPEHRSLDPTKGRDNNDRGMALADEYFNVPRILAPEDLANPKIDEQSVMAYISFLRNATMTKKANLADKCRAYGPGLVEGIVDEAAPFVVETPAGAGKLEVLVKGPTSNAKVQIKNNNGKYDVSYNPTEPGEYEVHVTLDGQHIPGSIFHVTVLSALSLGGEGKIRVYFSTTSSTEKARHDKWALQELLEKKSIHLRSDFEPWIPVDVMDKKDRDDVFKKAGTKTLPIVFIDDVYTGDYDTMVKLNQNGELDRLLKVMERERLSAKTAKLSLK